MRDVDWTAVVLPDTQIYCKDRPHLLEAQVDWLLEARERERIRVVVHVGDVVDDNSDEQWARAATLRRLDGVVPYVIASGNHDLGPRGSGSDRDSGLSRWFAGMSVDGAFAPGVVDSAFVRWQTPTGPWLALTLEFAPRRAVLAWAREVLRAHPDHDALVATHAFLYSDGTRYAAAGERPDQKWPPHAYGVASSPEGGSDGEAIYRELVEPSPNVRLVVCGHVLNEGTARRTDARAGGGVVHQLLANYQHGREGGASYLRLLRFAGDAVRVHTYSPWLDEELTDAANRFDLSLVR